MNCGHATIPAHEITRATLRRLDVRGRCLECVIEGDMVAYWQHGESDCAFLVPMFETWDALECEELTADMFFDRIANRNFSYDLMY